MITGIGSTGILHLLNKTIIEWFSKSQVSVETAIYGSKYVAAQISVDNIVDLRHTLRYLGVSHEGPAWIFIDNLAVVNSSTLPSGKI